MNTFRAVGASTTSQSTRYFLQATESIAPTSTNRTLMTADDQSVQRPPTMVRCKRHGVFYNPDKYDGCAVCRSGSQQTQEYRRFSPITFLIGIAGVAVIGLVVGKGTRSVAARGDAVMAETSRTAVRLDPNAFRSEVESLEAIVYAEGAASFHHGSSILHAANTLSDVIRSKEVGLIGQSRQHQAILEIQSFGQRQAAAEDVGYAVMDLSQARADWEEVRARVFREADWFRHATPRMGSVARSAAEQTTHASTLRMLADLATEMDQTVRFARSHSQRFGEPTGDPRSSETERQLADWMSFCQAMQTRLHTITDVRRAGGVPMPNDALATHQYLMQAADYLSRLVTSRVVPPENVRNSTLNDAERLVEQAKLRLQGMQP